MTDKAELVPVCVDQVGQRLQLLPLLLVVRVLEAPGIGALSRGLQFLESDKGI